MKTAFLILSVIFSLNASASGPDPFQVQKDGYTFQCNVVSSGGGYGSVECANAAYSGVFSREESLQLCQGAVSIEPANCAKDAYAGVFDRSESIQLCIRATSISPSACAKQAYSGPFSRQESVQLCSNNGTVARAQCAIRAYSGPYSKEQAIQLCQGAAHLVNIVLESVQGPDFQSVLKKANAKATLNGENFGVNLGD